MRLGFAQSYRRAAFAAFVSAIAVGGAVATAGCGTVASASTNASHTLVMHDNANGKTIWVRPGDRVELILSSSYWQVTGSSAPRVLRQDGRTVLLPRPQSCPPIPGLGCRPVRTDFTAVAHGKAIIKASRTTCGEALRCSPRNSHFTLTVMVR